MFQFAKHCKITSPKWMSKRILKCIKKRNRAWTEHKEAPSFHKLRKYREKRNKVNGDIKKSKRNFEEKLSEKIKTEPKAFYAYVRSKSKTKDRVGPLLNNSGALTDDKKEMSDILNDYFSTVFTIENFNKLPKIKAGDKSYQPTVQNEFETIDIMEERYLMR